MQSEERSRRLGLWIFLACASAAFAGLIGAIRLAPAPRPAQSSPLQRTTATRSLPQPTGTNRLIPDGPNDYLRVGQRFEFQQINQSYTLLARTTVVWTIRAIDPDEEVVYDEVSTTRISYKTPTDGLRPIDQPKPGRRAGQRFSLKAPPEPTAAPLEAERIEVSGVVFPCTVGAGRRGKTWTCARFPGVIQWENDAGSSRRLVKISFAAD